MQIDKAQSAERMEGREEKSIRNLRKKTARINAISGLPINDVQGIEPSKVESWVTQGAPIICSERAFEDD